jgi:hypothetical protein
MPAPRLRSESVRPGRTDVFFEGHGEWLNLTQFDRPQHLYGFELSPDQNWIFVWHMTAPPRLLSIYDTLTLKRVCCFAPGYGGAIAWTPGNNLLHRWGAGMSAFCYAVYAPDGRTLLVGNSSVCEQSPSGQFLATFAYEDGNSRIEVQDLKRIGSTFAHTVHDLQFCREMTWTASESLVTRFETYSGVEQTFTLERKDLFGR